MRKSLLFCAGVFCFLGSAGASAQGDPLLLTSITPTHIQTQDIGEFTQFRLRGTGFLDTGQLQVLFGDVPAISPHYDTTPQPPSVEGYIPMQGGGTVDITFINADGAVAVLEDAFTYEPSQPEIWLPLRRSHGSEAGGEEVQIFGAQFFEYLESGLEVYFGNAAAEVNWQGNGLVECIVPPGAPGTVDVTLRNPDGVEVVAEDAYTYIAVDAPRITSVLPTTGTSHGGTEVEIEVVNMDLSGGAEVFFDERLATDVQVDSGSNTIECVSPIGRGVATLTVIAGGETAVAGGAFRFEPRTPGGIKVVPPVVHEGGGEVVYVYVTNTHPESPQVFFGEVAVQPETFFLHEDVLQYSKYYYLRCVTPPGEGVVDVTIQNFDGGVGTLAGGLTYSSEVSPVQVESVTPNPLPKYRPLHVFGHGFDAAFGQIYFGGRSCTLPCGPYLTYVQSDVPQFVLGFPFHDYFNSPLEIMVVSHTRGSVYPVPIILGDPEFPLIDPFVEDITGGAFRMVDLEQDIPGGSYEVLFDDVPATNVVHVDAAEGERDYVTGISPPHAEGTVSVTVQKDGQPFALIEDGFTYYREDAPRVSTVTPNRGHSEGGTEVRIDGLNFNNSDALQVWFGAVAATEVNLHQPMYEREYITCRTPASTECTVDVTVVNPSDASFVLNDGFTYTGEPPCPAEGEGEGETVDAQTAQEILGAFESSDLDDSGSLSYEEASGARPGLTQAAFDALDLDDDMQLSAAELATASVTSPVHTVDLSGDGAVQLQELLRVVQFFNLGGYHCDDSTTDGFGAGFNETQHDCLRHAADYLFNWQISLPELLRVIQFFNVGGYEHCPGEGTADGFCAATN